MSLTIILILAIAAFICCVASAMGRCPDWVWGIPLCIIALLYAAVPIGR